MRLPYYDVTSLLRRNAIHIGTMAKANRFMSSYKDDKTIRFPRHI